MLFNYRYHGETSIANSAKATEMSFSPDTFRSPTFFIGELSQSVPYREAMSALHDVVISDLRFKPKDRSEYMRWLEQNEQKLLAEFMQQGQKVQTDINHVRHELDLLYKNRESILAPYYKSRQNYFNYLYERDRDAWFVLDPVITINPDELFFECFSLDESCYGRLSCNFDVFKNIKQFACGTTNIDYSADLYLEFQKIRNYKTTELKVDPGGFEVSTGDDDSYTENKIDLPESWVRGFLQVSSAMTLPLKTIKLHPMDVYNICFILKRKKEKQGPRSLRFILNPGQPVRIIFEPWNQELVCKRSVYLGSQSEEIRLWGRRRLLILERLLPIAQEFSVHLLGTGLPSFFIAHMPGMTFTLGLSGWTANDWSRAGNFDLMAPRAEVDEFTRARVFKALSESWVASADVLAQNLNIDKSLVTSALQIYTQAGRVIYDLNKNVYRLRELSREPLPMEKLRFANEREDKANRFIAAKLVDIQAAEIQNNMLEISGQVLDNAKPMKACVVIDSDQCLIQGQCECHFYVHNKLYKGPCEHMLALRIKFNLDKGRRAH